MIVRGDNERIPLGEADLIRLCDDGYRWSGHTHITTGDVSLMPSRGDIQVLEIFGQKNSVIYNAEGKYGLIIPLERGD